MSVDTPTPSQDLSGATPPPILAVPADPNAPSSERELTQIQEYWKQLLLFWKTERKEARAEDGDEDDDGLLPSKDKKNVSSFSIPNFSFPRRDFRYWIRHHLTPKKTKKHAEEDADFERTKEAKERGNSENEEGLKTREDPAPAFRGDTEAPHFKEHIEGIGSAGKAAGAVLLTVTAGTMIADIVDTYLMKRASDVLTGKQGNRASALAFALNAEKLNAGKVLLKAAVSLLPGVTSWQEVKAYRQDHDKKHLWAAAGWGLLDAVATASLLLPVGGVLVEGAIAAAKAGRGAIVVARGIEAAKGVETAARIAEAGETAARGGNAFKTVEKVARHANKGILVVQAGMTAKSAHQFLTQDPKGIIGLELLRKDIMGREGIDAHDIRDAVQHQMPGVPPVIVMMLLAQKSESHLDAVRPKPIDNPEDEFNSMKKGPRPKNYTSLTEEQKAMRAVQAAAAKARADAQAAQEAKDAIAKARTSSLAALKGQQGGIATTMPEVKSSATATPAEEVPTT